MGKLITASLMLSGLMLPGMASAHFCAPDAQAIESPAAIAGERVSSPLAIVPAALTIGTGERTVCRGTTSDTRADTRRFRLDDIHLSTTLSGTRLLNAWEEDRDAGVLRQRSLTLPDDREWYSVAGSSTLMHVRQARRTNAAACTSGSTGRCASALSVVTLLQPGRHTLQLVQHTYLNGAPVESVSWVLGRP